MTNELGKLKSLLLFLSIIVPISSCVLMSVSLVYGFAVALILEAVFLITSGIRISDIKTIILQSLIECKSIYILILLIGGTVSIWLGSGVVPTMIYYGSMLLEGSNILLMSFVITLIASTFMGTAVGTISTMGIAVLGIGSAFGIPTYIQLGAIVSGAFISDKIAPISGLLNLTMENTDTKYKGTVKNMLATLVPTMLITGALYYIIGTKYMGGVSSGQVADMQKMISDSFKISPVLLLIPVLIVVLSLRGIPTLKSISAGFGVGILTTIFYQGVSVKQTFIWILTGYRGNSSYEYINNLLFSGGVKSMIEVILIVMGAVAVSGLLEKTGILRATLKGFIENIKNKNQLILKTGIMSMLLTVVTCDQTIGIIVPSRFLKDKYDRMGVKREVLVRTISDTGTIIAPVMPWNVNAIIIGSVTGIAGGYGKYCFLCLLFPVVTFIVSFIENKLSKDIPKVL